jgi:ubiquitin carboxyl-terminal hydrolase 36/42
VAEKQFTIHDAPAVLTVHLKRFSPLGRKIGHLVSYPEQLSLSPYMSSGQFGPSYSMYGVVSHAGSGPNSGHYYAHVKAADGRWYNMNDDMVSPVPKAPTALKSAYMLFYVRDKGQALQAVVAAGTSTTLAPSTPMLPRAVNKPSIVGSMKKRKAEDEENRPPAESSRVKRQAVGPLLPDGAFIGPKLPVSVAGDPQARALAEKIAVANGKQGGQAMAGSKTSKLAMKLVDYEDDSESGSDAGEVVSKEQQKENHAQSQDHAMADNVVSVSENLSSPPANDDALAEAAASMSSTYTAAQPSVSTSRTPAALPLLVPPMNFYNSDKKRKEAEEEEEDDINDGDDDGDDDGPPASAPVRPAARTSNGQEHRAPFSPRKKNKQFAAGNGNKRRHSQGAFSPYDRVKGSNNLHEQRSDNRKPFVKQTYGNRRRR